MSLIGNAITRAMGPRVASAFGYDAAEPGPTRKTRKVVLTNEDLVLGAKQRRQAISNTRELRRNFAVAAWALRTHCAHVAQHTFQARTSDPGFDDQLEAFIAEWSRPGNCDAAGRHSLDRMIWLAEMCRITDGDCLLHDLNDGRWQLIEGDRLGNPDAEAPAGLNLDDFTQGIELDKRGLAKSYLINTRTKSSKLVFSARLKGEQVLHHGCFDRADQVRGVSPMLAALNTFQDVAESAEYALAKAKVSAFFGLKFKRGEGWEPDETSTNRSVKLGKGPAVFEHAHDEAVDFLSVDQPGPAFREYLNAMLMMALKALDLDFAFYDSAHTNYSGARQAMLLYQRSSAIRKREVQDLRGEMTRRRIRLAAERRELTLPRGLDATQVRFEWVPAGMGWIDPLKEVRAHAAAIAAGLRSRQGIVRETGGEWRDVARELAEEAAHLDELGLDTANAAQLAALAASPQDEDAPPSNQDDTP